MPYVFQMLIKSITKLSVACCSVFCQNNPSVLSSASGALALFLRALSGWVHSVYRSQQLFQAERLPLLSRTTVNHGLECCITSVTPCSGGQLWCLQSPCTLVCVGVSLEPAEIKMGSQGDSKTRCGQPQLKMWE